MFVSETSSVDDVSHLLLKHHLGLTHQMFVSDVDNLWHLTPQMFVSEVGHHWH
jgi:hypothetical protein